jgi:hypothetical protein
LRLKISWLDETRHGGAKALTREPSKAGHEAALLTSEFNGGRREEVE